MAIRKGGAEDSPKIAHVLFMDLVGYSKLPMEDQLRQINLLKRVVTGTAEYKRGISKDQVIPLPTGDGMALVFQDDLEAPPRCALAVAAALRKYPEIQLRMGINSGPVYPTKDPAGNPNAAGAGINYAQRVMDCGDAGHILLSDHTAKDLSNFAAWKDHLHSLGEFTVKHGIVIHLYNLHKDGIGNPNPPSRLPSPVTEDPRHYLEALREDNCSIEIRGLQTGRGRVYAVPLEDLYIPLMTTADSEAAAEKSPARARTVPLEEALQHPRLVIIGDPGSGKSTFLKWIVTKSTDKDFPVLIRVGELAAHIRGRKPGDGPSTPHSPGWLPHFLGAQSAENKWGLSAAYFDRKLEEGCLAMLDGLDEASSDEERQAMAKLLQNATKAYAKSRFVVTTRPKSYTEKTALAGFQMHRIAELEREAVKNFLSRWSSAVKLESQRAGARHFASLWEAVGSRKEILRMAKNPVMLTALAVLHWNNKKLPDQRAELYGSILDWLAESRQDRPGREKKPRQCLELLQRLALAMQLHPEGRQVQVPRYWAAEKLNPDPLDTALRFLEEEEKDSGIIVSRGADVRFWHLTFQEFLAAKELGGQDALREQLTKDQKIFSAEWREMVLLMSGVLYEQGKPRANGLTGALLDTLTPNPSLAGASLADRARCVGLLGAIERDLRPFDYKVGDERYQAALNAVYGIFDRKRAAGIDFNVRLEAAEALGQAGDRRLMVDKPEDHWIRIEAGMFRMGADQQTDEDADGDESPVHEVYLDAYLIGRYPITVEEYRRFVESDGFGELKEPYEWEEQKLHPTRPVVSVSWDDAAAYCKWAGGRLPTEAEWERAARGVDGRKYAWGSETPDPGRANYSEGGPMHPTPVGLYPHGSTPEGICDMAGNVWEWVADWYDEERKYRVLRGGSWGIGSADLRAAGRSRDLPDVRNDDIGFRCAREVLP